VISDGIALSGAEIAGGSLALREAYLPALDNALSSLFIEEGIPATVRFGIPAGVGEEEPIFQALLEDVPGLREQYFADIEQLANDPLSGWPTGIGEAFGQRVVWTDWGRMLYNYVPAGHEVVLRSISYTRPLVAP
jgi:hypothetical protein